MLPAVVALGKTKVAVGMKNKNHPFEKQSRTILYSVTSFNQNRTKKNKKKRANNYLETRKKSDSVEMIKRVRDINSLASIRACVCLYCNLPAEGSFSAEAHVTR